MFRTIIITLISFAFSINSLWAISESAADKAYRAKNYVEALRLYQAMEKKGTVSANVFYNIGNCYYRQNNYPKAILYYSRSLRLDPSDADTRFNLRLSSAKIGSSFSKQPEMFFISWTKDVVSSRSANQWGAYGTAALVVLLLSASIYFFSNKLRLKRICLGFAIVAMLAIVAFQAAAAYQNFCFNNKPKAVVMNQASINLDTTGGKASQLTVVPGVVVDILDQSPDGSLQVGLPDGRTGWTNASNLEKV